MDSTSYMSSGPSSNSSTTSAMSTASTASFVSTASSTSHASVASAGAGAGVDASPEFERIDDLRIEHEYLFKILLVGSAAVGKSSIVSRFAEMTCPQHYVSTIGVDFKICTLRVDGKVVKLQIWDTAGQERFRAITTSYYRGAHGVALVYDVTDASSLDDVENVWVEECRKYARPDAAMMLVGNKTDLEGKKKDWGERAMASSIAAEHGMSHVRTSAKDGTAVDTAIVGLVRRLMKDRRLVDDTKKPYPVIPSVKPVGGTRSSLTDCCRMS